MSSGFMAIFHRPPIRRPDVIFIPAAYMQCQFAGKSIPQPVHSAQRITRDVICIRRNRAEATMEISKHRSMFMTVGKEVARRGTFAFISHPDAGKTTLTEKLLLFAGAIHIAGSVKARKASRHATSDWMEIEKQRGISVASSVMQLEYGDCVINLLDTPGHQDFSEDTYRVLTAVDAALMVIDAVNGVEAQTIRLLEGCRARKTPIITFINKLDREGREPLELLDEIERVLKMPTVPFTYPVGMGKRFGGVFDIRSDRMRIFKAGEDRAGGDEEVIEGIDNPVNVER